MNLIDRDKLLGKAHYDDFDRLVVDWEDIKNAPTVYAEPVVRCRDCVYWDDWEDERLIGWRYCAMIDTKTEGSWFCADGEKKDGKHDGTD